MSEVSTILVNSPPRFLRPSGPGGGGAKRNTVFMREDLNTYVPGAADNNRAWTLNAQGATHTIAQVDSAHVLQIFGLNSGRDTLMVTAKDPAGNRQSMNVTARVLGQGEALKLRSIPDIQFIAGVPFSGLHLNEFVIDRQAHPASALRWRAWALGTSPLIVTVQGDSVFAISTVVAEAVVVFEVLDVAHNSVGRDTVRVFSLDPSTASQPLKDLPPITFTTAQEDSSLFLDDFLPEGVSRASVRWAGP